MKICKVAIYDESNVPQICTDKLVKFLHETFGIKAEIYNPFSYTSKDVSECTVTNMLRPLECKQSESGHENSIPMYDGICLQRAFAEMIPHEHQHSDWLYVVFTAKLIGTYDYDGCRYHARALIGSNPAIISTTGIIEAPAKPRLHYISEATKVPYDGWNDWLKYGDNRLEYTARAYLMQSLAYYATGSAFCKDAKCILYNAHWQQEMVKSQIESGSLCKDHRIIIQDMVKNSRSEDNKQDHLN